MIKEKKIRNGNFTLRCFLTEGKFISMVELTGATRNQLREERFLASEASSFGERFWRAKRGIQYTQKIFGKRSEPLGEKFWRVKRSVISPPPT